MNSVDIIEIGWTLIQIRLFLLGQLGYYRLKSKFSASKYISDPHKKRNARIALRSNNSIFLIASSIFKVIDTIVKEETV